LKLTDEQNQEYYFLEVLKHIRMIRSGISCKNGGEKAFLSLAPGIINGLYQKVADF
jgi:hypothetical protein